MATHLYLIRHGRQSDKRCNVDVDLSPEGREQARLVGERLAGWGIDALFASTMIRARETATIIGEALGLGMMVRPELRELNFGEMEGLSDEEIAVTFADFQRAQSRMELDLSYPGGENISQVLQRSITVFDEIARCDRKRVAIVTHGVSSVRSLHTLHVPRCRGGGTSREILRTVLLPRSLPTSPPQASTISSNDSTTMHTLSRTPTSCAQRGVWQKTSDCVQRRMP
ncbi:histidine phosphatase family protein [Arcanobacterium canis]